MRPRVVLVKPPERSEFNFGTYSLGVLAAAVRDRAEVSILDATDLVADEAAARVLGDQPQLVGITTMGTASVRPVADFLRRLRAEASARCSEVTVVCGGHGATCLPAPLLAAGADAVVIGEGEVTFRRVVEHGKIGRAHV